MQIVFVDCSKEKNNPENLVLSLFVAAIAVRYQFMFAKISVKVDQATRADANTQIFRNCTRIRDFVVNETGSLLSKLDICLTGNTQPWKFPFNATLLTNSITRGLNSLYCFMTFDSIPITLDIRRTPIACKNVHEFMTDLKPLLEPYLDIAIGNFDLHTFENQMRTLNWCMKLLPRDGLLSEWWELTEVYLKVLRNGIEGAIAEGEIYYVGHINRILLKILIRGNSKDNYDYAQIEEVARNLAAALKACEDWAPPVWKNEVEGL
jgi:hypothetical protein